MTSRDSGEDIPGHLIFGFPWHLDVEFRLQNKRHLKEHIRYTDRLDLAWRQNNERLG
jgi:hypothetical protein